MIHWNQRQCIAYYSSSAKPIACAALDSNFKLRPDVTPFQGEDSNFKEWISRILIPNSKGVMAGVIILTYGLENYNNCARLCQDLCIDCLIVDVLSVALFINDCDGMHLRKISFPKTKLTYLCSAVGAKAPKGKWYECMQIANFYKGVTEKGLI